MFDLPAYLERNNARIHRALNRLLATAGPDGRLLEAMRYSLMAGGKRLRPNLCLAAAEAVGGDAEEALTAACALEMIHTYSLIHDDLPAMDDDKLRRGKATCHIAFDEATAILAGDALLTMAFETLGSLPGCPPERCLEVTRIVAAAAGSRGMVQGQMLDMLSQGTALSLEQLENLHSLKTGAMIEASLATGGLLAGGRPAQIEALRAFGRRVGLAFQVVDDILNIEGDPAVMGKAAGTDRLRRKNSYPGLLGLAKSKEFAHNLVSQAVEAIAAFDAGAEALRAIACYVLERHK
jgi:geranylgeranyl diphosphate synthase type II